MRNLSNILLLLSAVLLVQTGCAQSVPREAEVSNGNQQSKTETEYLSLRPQAEEVANATVKGDFGRLVDFTYPKVVAELGGREKMIAFLETSSKRIKAEGFELQAVKVGEISQIARTDSQVFAVIPITLTMKSPEGRALGEGSLLAISDDNGATWKFIDGVSQEKLKTMFPKAADTLRIPAAKPPVLIGGE